MLKIIPALIWPNGKGETALWSYTGPSLTVQAWDIADIYDKVEETMQCNATMKQCCTDCGIEGAMLRHHNTTLNLCYIYRARSRLRVKLARR